MPSPTAIIFGATGFIGSHVAEQLLLAGIPVTAAVRRGTDTTLLRHLGAAVTVVDFSDEPLLAQAMRGHALVINCIASRNMQECIGMLRTTEVELTGRLVRAAAAAGAQRFLQLSTIQVYGFERPPLAIDETFPIKPVYDFSRVNAEREAMVSAEAQRLGIEYVLLRPVNALGSRDDKLLPMLKAHHQGLFMMVGDNARFSAIDARDIGRAMTLLATTADAANNTYLVKGFDTSWREFKQELDHQTGHAARELHLSPRLAHALGWLGEQLPRRWQVPLSRFSMAVMATDTLFDDSRIRRVGFTPRYGLSDAVGAMLNQR